MREQCPFIRVDEVARLTGLSKREVWRKSSSDASFPRKRKRSIRVTVWMRDEVMEYIEREKAALA